jgi:tetratricopeptide (TPR) repeat protein
MGADSMTRISLCMIVRDAAKSLERAIVSARPWVDDVVVVDTGSADETPRIAAALGARVFHFPWRDDFSAARNESLRHATGDWIFWLDADEWITEDAGRTLRELAESTAADGPMALVMQQHSAAVGADGAREPAVIQQVRMFRNRPELRFDGRVHEQIMPAVVRAGGRIAWADVRIEHSGYDDPEVRRGKLERDLRLLHLELAERPDRPFALFNLGMTLAGLGEQDAAADALKRCLAAADGEETYLPNAYAFLISGQLQGRRLDAAWETCREARGRFPDDRTLLFHEGLLTRETGQHSVAVRIFESLLRPSDERSLFATDPDPTGCKARHNLALSYGDIGRHDLAEFHWRQLLAAAPDNEPAWRGLIGCLLRQRKVADAKNILQEFCRRWPDNAEARRYLHDMSV